jgi:hypothetical protein
MSSTTIMTHFGPKYGKEATNIIKNLPVLDTGATDHVTNCGPTKAVNIRKSNVPWR